MLIGKTLLCFTLIYCIANISNAEHHIILVKKDPRFSISSYRMDPKYREETEAKFPQRLVAVGFDDAQSRSDVSSLLPTIPIDINTQMQECDFANGNHMIYSIRDRKNPINIKYFLNDIDANSSVTNSRAIKKLDNILAGNFMISHDGKKALFTTYKLVPDKNSDSTREWGSISINVIDLQTEELKQIVPFGGVCCAPAFSPDDKSIAFYYAGLEVQSVAEKNSGMSGIKDQKGFRLCLVSPDGGPIQYLSEPADTDRDLKDYSPSWSPDGKKIAYEQVRNYPDDKSRPLVDVKETDIFIMELVGHTSKLIASPHARNPVWSPNGRYIAYANGNSAFILDLDKGETMTIDEHSNMFAWDPSSKFLAYRRFDSETKNLLLWIISPDGKTRRSTDVEVDRQSNIYFIK